MTSHRCAAAAIAIAALSASCGASGGDSDDGTGSLGDAVEVAASAPGAAGGQACELDQATVQTAADAFFAITGSPATAEQELVDEGLLREPSELFDLTADGDVVPAAGGPCG